MAVITYSIKKDGQMKLSENFTVKEFACSDGSDEVKIDSDLIYVLQKVRSHFGKPVIISSAYRTVSHNTAVGGSKTSQHLFGTAADIYINGVDPLRIALYIESLDVMKNKGGIGLYSRSGNTLSGFVHVDVRAVKSRWISKTGTAYISTIKIMSTIRNGDRDGTNGIGYAVTVLQRHLGVSDDGIFGNATKTALIEWQNKHNLTADGIAGPKTWDSF